MTAGTLPAQGLRVLRGALGRARDVAGRLARERVRPAVPGRGDPASDRFARRAARWPCSGSRSSATPTMSATRSHTKLIRLLERELADVAVCDPHAPVAHPAARPEAVRADVVIVATNHSAFEGRGRPRRSSPGRPATASWSIRGTRSEPSQVFVYGAEAAGDAPIGGRASRVRGDPHRDEPRARHRRRRDDRLCRRQAPSRRQPVGGPGGRPSPAAAVDARGVRDPHHRPARVDARARRGRGLLPRDSPGRDRRRDRELPQASVHADQGQQRADGSGRPRRGQPRRRAPRVRVVLDGVRVRDRVPDDRGAPRRLPRRRARPTGSRSSPARSTHAPPTTSTACATRSAARSTPTALGSSPTPTSRG